MHLNTSAVPCVMCAGAIYWAGIGRVVYGQTERALKAQTGAHEENPTLDLPCDIVLRPASARPKWSAPCSRTRLLSCRRISGPRGGRRRLALGSRLWAVPNPTGRGRPTQPRVSGSPAQRRRYRFDLFGNRRTKSPSRVDIGARAGRWQCRPVLRAKLMEAPQPSRTVQSDADGSAGKIAQPPHL